VIFYESTFPLAVQPSAPSPEDYAFLDDFTNPVPLPVGIAPLLSPAGTSGNTALPRAVVPTVSLPLDATSSAVPLLISPLQAASTALPCAAVPQPALHPQAGDVAQPRAAVPQPAIHPQAADSAQPRVAALHSPTPAPVPDRRFDAMNEYAANNSRLIMGFHDTCIYR